MQWLGLGTFTASAWIQTLTGELNLLHAKQFVQTKKRVRLPYYIIVIPRKIMLFNLTMSLAREGNGTPLQYSCLENPVDGGAWRPAVHGVAEGQTRLSNFTLTFHFHALEKEMATHSSVLAWRIPGTGKPGGLPSMGSHRVEHD